MLLNPIATIVSYIDMKNTMTVTIQIEIANMILICFVSLVGFTILNAIVFAILPTINISNTSAIKNPGQKSFKRLLKNWEWNPSLMWSRSKMVNWKIWKK